MDERNDGGPAFPEVVTHLDYDYDTETRYPNTQSVGGMTLRDFLAAHVSVPEAEGIGQQNAEALMGEKAPDWSINDPLPCLRWWAEAEGRWKYLQADAMLKAREAK